MTSLGLAMPRWAGSPGTPRLPVRTRAAAVQRPRAARPGMRVDFAYRDEALLLPDQREGGRVWIPRQALVQGGQYPLVVLLHGVSSEARPEPHRLLDGPQDLSGVARRLIDAGIARPVLIAAPSQTAEVGSPATLWTEDRFDLDEFVAAVDLAVVTASGVRVRRDHIAVLGHSGAACLLTSSRTNGVLQVAQQVRALAQAGLRVRLLGLMDTCFFGGGGGTYLRRSLAGTGTRLLAMWVDPEEWSRHIDRGLETFAEALDLDAQVTCDERRYESCLGDVDGSVLLKARSDVLLAAFHDHRPEADQLAPHSAVPLVFMEEILRRYYGTRPTRATLEGLGSGSAGPSLASIPRPSPR